MSSYSLPEKIPVMVFGQVTHFPGMTMPLHIFEPRFRQMLDYALEGDRVFGVGYLRPEAESDTEKDAVEPIFTAGLIRSCRTREDGTSDLFLEGLSRVEVVDWLQIHPFRVASVMQLPEISLEPLREQQLAEELVALFRQTLLSSQSDDPTINMVDQILDTIEDHHNLVNLLGHHLLREPHERQEFLELIDLGERLETLIQFLKEPL